MKPLELRIVSVRDLIAAEDNPRTISAKARCKLKASLERFGLVEPLVWNERSGRVVGGHQRLAILRELGVAEVPVSVVNLDGKQEAALNIVLNNLEAQGRYDTARLAGVLAGLDPVEELPATGFDVSILKTLEFVPELQSHNEETCDSVEITLSTDRATYASLAPKLDALIRDYDLVSHVRFPLP